MFTLQKREQQSCPDESGRAHAAQGFSALAERFLAVRSFRNTTSWSLTVCDCSQAGNEGYERIIMITPVFGINDRTAGRRECTWMPVQSNSFRSSTRTTKQDAYFQIFYFPHQIKSNQHKDRSLIRRSQHWGIIKIDDTVGRYLEDVVGGVVGEAVAAERGGAVGAEVVLLVLALRRVHAARLEELLRQQATEPLRGAAHGGHGAPAGARSALYRRGDQWMNDVAAGRFGRIGGLKGSIQRAKSAGASGLLLSLCIAWG